jgi:phytoene dehydrogenase-like protein
MKSGSRRYDAVVARGPYRSGSAAWPGGCLRGAPGHNAAQEVIARLRTGHV